MYTILPAGMVYSCGVHIYYCSCYRICRNIDPFFVVVFIFTNILTTTVFALRSIDPSQPKGIIELTKKIKYGSYALRRPKSNGWFPRFPSQLYPRPTVNITAVFARRAYAAAYRRSYLHLQAGGYRSPPRHRIKRLRRAWGGEGSFSSRRMVSHDRSTYTYVYSTFGSKHF